MPFISFKQAEGECGEAAPSAGPSQRTRRFSTRSRSGCTACRRRRVKCDEGQPSCTRCIYRQRLCEYDLVLSAKEKRLQDQRRPGEGDVWRVSRQLPESGVDPYDCLPIKMDTRSRELMYYFAQVNKAAGGTAANSRNDSLAYVTASQEPWAFRSTLLLASVHYLYTTGSLKHFQPTYLNLRGECIRAINDMLVDPVARRSHTCLKLIAALSVIEGCQGALDVAESHLRGFLAILDEEDSDESASRSEDENELIEREFLLMFHTISGLRGRIPASTVQRMSLMDQWLKQDVSCHPERLEGLRLEAYTFVTPSCQTTGGASIAKATDIGFIIDELRVMTRIATDCFLAAAANPGPDWHAVVLPRLWTSGQQVRLMLAKLKLHRNSVFGMPSPARAITARREGDFRSSINGFLTALGLYCQSVLGIWNAGEPYAPWTFRHALTTLQDDARATEPAMLASMTNRDLWLWKVFVAAIALAKTEDMLLAAVAGAHSSKLAYYDEPDLPLALRPFRASFRRYIRAWSTATGVKGWEAAQEALERVCWPRQFAGTGLAKSVWIDSIG